jgi:hypothetical protein
MKLPPLENIPVYTVDYAKDYGFVDLTSKTIDSLVNDFENNSISNALNYLSDKLGFPHSDKTKFEEGLDLAVSWSLINSKHTKADNLYC